MIGASEDGFKLLFAKGFIIVFETGIIVISHWKRNNYIQKDRYKETMYKSEKSFLKINGSNVYEKTDIVCIQSGYKSDTQVSIGKDRLDKVNVGKGSVEQENQVTPFSFYGEYKNIRLTDKEYQKLKNRLQGHTDTMIEKLSRYIKSKGTDYQDHYVTILNWYEQDKDKLSQKKTGKMPTLEDYDKGEHL